MQDGVPERHTGQGKPIRPHNDLRLIKYAERSRGLAAPFPLFQFSSARNGHNRNPDWDDRCVLLRDTHHGDSNRKATSRREPAWSIVPCSKILLNGISLYSPTRAFVNKRCNFQVYLIDWVKSMVANQEVAHLLDPWIPEIPPPKDLKRILLIALMCVDPDLSQRPNIGHVVHMLESHTFLVHAFVGRWTVLSFFLYFLMKPECIISSLLKDPQKKVQERLQCLPVIIDYFDLDITWNGGK